MRYCLALDLKDDPALIAEYERYHERIWPDIETSIRDAGITEMENLSHRKSVVHDNGNGRYVFRSTPKRHPMRPIQLFRRGKPCSGRINRHCQWRNPAKSGC